MRSSVNVAWASGHPDHYFGPKDLGDWVPCVRPIPPPGLTFSIETYVGEILDGTTTKYSIATGERMP